MATTVIPGPWMVGKNAVVFGITPQTSDSTGVNLTDGTFQSLLGKFESVEYQFSTRTENIKAANAGIDDEVILSDLFSIRLTEIIPGNGNSNLLSVYLNFDYLRTLFQAAPANGLGTAGRLLSVIGVRKGCSYQVNEGKNVAVLELGTAGVPPTWV